MDEEDNDIRYQKVSDDIIEYYLKEKYKMVYSQRLGKKLFVLKHWVSKSIFQRHRRLFGYTDIGWTVKHPKQLIRVLVREEEWEIPVIEKTDISKI